MDLTNKHIVITGSTDGLGKLLAIELAKKHANIIIVGRAQQKIDETLIQVTKHNPKGDHSYVLCDLANTEEIAKSFANNKKVDILVNCAGIWAEGPTIDINPDRIIELVNVNLTAYMLVFRTLLPKLLESEFGQLLNVISVAGYEVPTDYFHTIYSATKYGLQGFTEAVAKEFDNTNLRIMGFYPGGMDTDLFKKAGETYAEKEPWMFDPIEAVEAIIFMLTRNEKVNVKRLDLINHLQ